LLLLAPHHLSPHRIMEIIYDSKVDITLPSGTQCITHGQAEHCRRAQAASGTPAYTNPLHDTSVEHHKPEELPTMTKADSDHHSALASIMRSDVGDGEGSVSSNLTSTSSFLLKNNASTIGLASHPMVSTRCWVLLKMNSALTLSLSLKHTNSVGLGNPAWNNPTSGNCLESPQLSPSPQAPSSVRSAHAASQELKNDCELDVDELVRLQISLNNGLTRDSRLQRNLRSIA
jgi:hypothetical protein